MRLLSLVVCLCVLTAGLGAPRVTAGQTRRPVEPLTSIPVEFAAGDRLGRLERWLKATARHAPGTDDNALKEVAAWANPNLRELWIDANVLIQIMRGHGGDRFSVRSGGQAKTTQIRYTMMQLLRLHLLACAAGGALVETECRAIHAADRLDPELTQLAALARAAVSRGDDNYILRRGALLHSDIAMLAPLAMTATAEAPWSIGPQRLRMAISDGRQVDLHQSVVHWEIARMLLAFVKAHGSDRPAPGRDEMVRQWYRATAAWMQLREDHDKLHLDEARALFPADPDILFLSGCQHETYAGPQIQTAARSAVLPTGVTLDVGSDRSELREAETMFRRVLEVKPDHAEARLRHGRVLALLGRHADAVVELRRAAGELEDLQLRYYAELFLGAGEETLGNRDAAGAAYTRAAELSPRAQSPWLALSELARRHGDRPAALGAMERLFALSENDRGEHDDPWWWYYVVQARDADDLLDAMRQPFLSDRLP
jgi:tetratricopeptide (TPR) repeat protein